MVSFLENIQSIVVVGSLLLFLIFLLLLALPALLLFILLEQIDKIVKK